MCIKIVNVIQHCYLQGWMHTVEGKLRNKYQAIGNLNGHQVGAF